MFFPNWKYITIGSSDALMAKRHPQFTDVKTAAQGQNELFVT